MGRRVRVCLTLWKSEVEEDGCSAGEDQGNAGLLLLEGAQSQDRPGPTASLLLTVKP